MKRLAKWLSVSVSAVALGTAQVLAQTSIPVPSGQVNLPILPPLTVQNGRVMVRFGGQWIPLLDAAGDTATGQIYLPPGSPNTNDNSASTTAISQTRLSHVANAAALATWTNYGLPVMRDDVGVLYTDTGASCTQPDGGWQVQPATGHCWITDITHGAPIELWGGAKDDVTPNQIPANNDINALSAAGGGQLVFGATGGAQCYLFTAGVADNRPFVQKLGQPGGLCVDRGFAVGPIFQEGSTSATGILNKGVANISFRHSVTTTSGADVQFVGTRHAEARNILCHKGSYQCVAVDNSVLTEVNNLKTTKKDTRLLPLAATTPALPPTSQFVAETSIGSMLRPSRAVTFPGLHLLGA